MPQQCPLYNLITFARVCTLPAYNQWLTLSSVLQPTLVDLNPSMYVQVVSRVLINKRAKGWHRGSFGCLDLGKEYVFVGLPKQ
jgi:hypothetical protein